MPKIQVERSIKINAPVEVVYPALNDFNKWVEWSPWLIMEPEAKVDVADDAKSYKWEGSRVGSGNMKVREENKNQYIHFDLNFLKPWKSSNSTSFYLQAVEGGTEVKWTMDSKLPFFMFWMKKMMMAFVGADYERGLDMLKAYVENGEVYSKLGFKGESNFEGCNWLGIRTDCSIEIIASQMEADYAMLRAYSDENGDINIGHFFTIYHKWDIVRGRVKYTAAVAVKEIPADLPEKFCHGVIPATKVYILSHKGAYQYIGNAWSTAYSMHRNKEFKPKKGLHPFEVYLNDPKTTPEKDLVTEIHFPIK